jgi:hypothetical protein
VDEMRLASESGAGIVADGVAAFAEALAALAKNPGRRKQMGARGKQAVLPCHWDSLSQTYRDLLDRLSAPAGAKEGGTA